MTKRKKGFYQERKHNSVPMPKSPSIKDKSGDAGLIVKSPGKNPRPMPKSPSNSDRENFKELMRIIKRESSGGYSKTYRK